MAPAPFIIILYTHLDPIAEYFPIKKNKKKLVDYTPYMLMIMGV